MCLCTAGVTSCRHCVYKPSASIHRVADLLWVIRATVFSVPFPFIMLPLNLSLQTEGILITDWLTCCAVTSWVFISTLRQRWSKVILQVTRHLTPLTFFCNYITKSRSKVPSQSQPSKVPHQEQKIQLGVTLFESRRNWFCVTGQLVCCSPQVQPDMLIHYIGLSDIQ